MGGRPLVPCILVPDVLTTRTTYWSRTRAPCVRALPYISRAWIVKADLAGDKADAVNPVPCTVDLLPHAKAGLR